MRTADSVHNYDWCIWNGWVPLWYVIPLTAPSSCSLILTQAANPLRLHQKLL